MAFPLLLTGLLTSPKTWEVLVSVTTITASRREIRLTGPTNEWDRASREMSALRASGPMLARLTLPMLVSEMVVLMTVSRTQSRQFTPLMIGTAVPF